MNKRTSNALNAIYDALFDLLAENTFDKITVRGLCKHANVNKMTFYKYHKDKYDALSQALRTKATFEFINKFGPDRKLIETDDVEYTVYRTAKYLGSWANKYQKQLKNIISSPDYLDYDITKTVLFEDYKKFVQASFSINSYDGNLDYVAHFLFGGLLSSIEHYLLQLRVNKNKEQVEKDYDDACKYLGKVYAAVVYTAREEVKQR